MSVNEEEKQDELNLSMKEMKLETKEIFDQMLWLCDLYSEIGEAEAKGIKVVRRDEVNWDRPLLNKKRQEIFKNSKTVIDGNYAALMKRGKKKTKRKVVPMEDGTVRSGFSAPITLSADIIKFFNEANLGVIEVNGKKVKVQKIVSGLNGKGVCNQNMVISLFGLWIYNGEMKDTKGNVVKKGLKCKDQKGKIVVDETFMKYFEKDIQSAIQEKKHKLLPIQNDKMVVDGKTVEVAYTIPYPTFLTCLFYAHRSALAKDQQEEHYPKINEETKRVKRVYEWTKENVKI